MQHFEPLRALIRENVVYFKLHNNLLGKDSPLFSLKQFLRNLHTDTVNSLCQEVAPLINF